MSKTKQTSGKLKNLQTINTKKKKKKKKKKLPDINPFPEKVIGSTPFALNTGISFKKTN